MPKLLAKLTISAFLLASLPATVLANTGAATQPKNECRLDQALDELLAVKDAKFKRPLERGSELEARKNLLEQIIVCSFIEIDAFKQKLSELDFNQEKNGLLRDALLKNLDETTQYYQEQLLKLSNARNDVSDVMRLAQSVEEWRNSAYAPLVAKINDFYLVTESGQAITTAKTRLQKIQNTLAIIKLNEVPRIKTLLSQASELLKKAATLHQDASETMWNGISVIENATSTEIVFKNQPAETQNSTSSEAAATSSPEKAPAKTVLALLKEALANIKAAYDDYIKISEAVKKILGL